jgi:hypothetical protein
MIELGKESKEQEGNDSTGNSKKKDNAALL